MRIVSGQFRGRVLDTPADQRTRPTSDRVREAMFNILTHGAPALDLAGVAVIDLFAGTGALGLEALSRGAASCVFVEQDADARGLIRRNIDGLGLGGVTRILRRDATDLGPASRGTRYGLAFLDPPYGQGLGEKAVTALIDGGWITPDATIVIEERVGVELTLPARVIELDRRAYGDTQVVFGRLSS